MIVLVANTSPLVPYQFPTIFQTNGPNFVLFCQEYFKWMEQEPQAGYWARQIFNIHDIDSTMDEFIVHFKNKYLQGIQFTTEADLRLVIKHALDIYRSKGTERCTKLIFQVAFDEAPSFYYPSTDLFKVSDGIWFLPNYLELQLEGGSGNPNNIALQQKEIRGITSGAIGFVDNIVRRKDNNKLADVAYISAIVGEFLQGETVIPTDGSLPVANCPSILGSMVELQLPLFGTGVNYNVGDVIPVSSNNGVGGLIRVANTEEVSGITAIDFEDGGYGFSFSQIFANVSYTAANGNFSNGSNIWGYYSNGSVAVECYVSDAVADNSSAGVLETIVLSGSFSNVANIYSFGNSVVATVGAVAFSNVAPVVYISEEQLTIGGLTMNTSNNDSIAGVANVEQSHFFNFMDTITQPQVEVSYTAANGPFVAGGNVTSYYSNGSVAGTGVVLNAVQLDSNNGTLLINSFTGNTSAFALELYNGFGGKCVPNVVSDVTATCNFIANSDTIEVNVENVTGNGFFLNENIFQMSPIPGNQPDQKQQGWGVVTDISLPANSSQPYVLTISNVVGRFIQGLTAGLIGETSQATCNVISANVIMGVINTVGNFFPAPYSYVYSPIMTGTLFEKLPAGSGFSITLPASVTYPENVSVNIDTGASFANVWANATAYDFPGNPSVNASSGNVADCMNFVSMTVGRLANAYISGLGVDYSAPPFVVVDNPFVSSDQVENDILLLQNAAANFFVGETVYQGNSTVWVARGEVLAQSNGDYLWLERMSYANDFVVTSNSTTGLVGAISGTTANVAAVDYDVFSSYMGRNAIIVPLFQTGNGSISSAQVVASGYGFVNGETIAIGSNGALGQVILGGMGTGSGYYTSKGGFLSDVKKLYDGYFYQNFSYQIISDLMVSRYYDMMMELTHPAGTIMFGEYVHTGETGGGLNIQNVLLTQANSIPGNTYTVELLHTISVAESYITHKKLAAIVDLTFEAGATHKGKVG
jgi:hypothetical protein